MKATQNTEVKVTGVTLNLTIEEAQVLKRISYLMLVKDGRPTLDMRVLGRLLLQVKFEADEAQMTATRASFSLETAREIQQVIEEALEAETKREDEERFAKENAAIVDARVTAVDGAAVKMAEEVVASLSRLRGAVDLLTEAVNP